MNIKTYQRGLDKCLDVVAGLASGLMLAGVPVSAWTAPIDGAEPVASMSGAASAPPPSCSVTPVYPIPDDPASLETLKIQLDAFASSCLRSPAFYAWRGAVLLAQRQTTAAIEALERALLLDPDLPGAQLDYINALLDIGDTASAKGLIEHLTQRSDLSTHLRSLLERELATISPQAWRTRWAVTTSLGFDSNLNNAPSASELTLTLAQGPVKLSLLESSQPQKGAASLNIFQWQGLKPQGGQLWLLQAELRARHTAEPTTRYQQADLAINWFQAYQASHQWIGRAGLTRIDFGGQQLLQSSRVSLVHQRAPLRVLFLPFVCRPSAGFELEYRRYLASPELNSRYAGLVGTINCTGSDSLSLQLRLGSDQADSISRPGGDYSRAELRATWEAHYGLFKLSADYGYTRQLDSSGYSPLLNSSLARQSSRHSLRAELAYPLSPSWFGGADGFVSAEISHQASNLLAFESRQKAVYAGLRWSLQ